MIVTKQDLIVTKQDLIVYCDGSNSSRGCGVGCAWFSVNDLRNPGDGKTLVSTAIPIYEISVRINRCTNNVSEYTSLIKALNFSIDLGLKEIIIFMDSKLVVNQVNGNWKINYDHLRRLKILVDILKRSIKITLIHVRREYNKVADKLSKDCLENSYIKNETRTFNKPKRNYKNKYKRKNKRLF